MTMPERAIRFARPGAADIRAAADLFHDPDYLALLGKAGGAAFGAGILARRLPALAAPIALLAGIYVGLELAAYLTRTDAPDRAIAARVIEIEETTHGEAPDA